MFVFKPINKSNVSITETQIYKKQSLTSGSSGISSVQFRSGSKAAGSDTVYSTSGSYWNSLHTLFYQSGSSLRSEDRFNEPPANLTLQSAIYPQYVNKFYTSGSIISIPQKYIGERIKPGTFKLTDDSTSETVTIQDDSHGNLYPVGNTLSQSVTSPSSSDNYVGNIFYDYGIVTITDTGSYAAGVDYVDVTTGNYSLSFNATQTIYTHEYTVTIKPSEFNHTMNSTVRGFTSGSTLTNPYETPYLKSEFTGSGWSPYISTIHLYSDNDEVMGTYDVGRNEMISLTEPVIIANLPRPIQIRSDMEMIFKIRIDL